MKADGAPLEVAGIHQAMNGIRRIRARMSLLHLERVERFELAAACPQILADGWKFSTSKRPVGTAIQQFWSR